jgi:hypothetical protein
MSSSDSVSDDEEVGESSGVELGELDQKSRGGCRDLFFSIALSVRPLSWKNFESEIAAHSSPVPETRESEPVSLGAFEAVGEGRFEGISFPEAGGLKQGGGGGGRPRTDTACLMREAVIKVEVGVTKLEPRTGKYGSVSEGGERTQDS